MSVSVKQFYPASHAIRPERKDINRNSFERVVWDIYGRTRKHLGSQKKQYLGFVNKVNKLGVDISTKSECELRELINEVKVKLHKKGFDNNAVALAFSIIREISERELGMRHYDNQLIGGWVLLHGMIAEMDTGEGKTLTAILPAATAALAGIPVHVISVNDYLVSRDAELMRPVYEYMGLSVGCVVQDMGLPERRAAYLCDICYCTNNELTFDYLKDILTLGKKSNSLSLQAENLYGKADRVENLLLRGLHYAIVDEVDSVLIDEARTPLVISGGGGDSSGETRTLHQAMSLLENLNNNIDYTIDHDHNLVDLTLEGEEKIYEETKGLGPLWQSDIRRKEVIKLALSAKYLFRRNEHYLVRDEKVQIIDQYTGRVMPDRSWERGLHQLIEIKEGCEISERRETMAKISYQRFFRRFLRLSGMTGTAREVENEFWNVYDLPVIKVPPHRTLKRKYYKSMVFLSETEKWMKVIERVKTINNMGRPILVGTRSVASSETASQYFKDEGLSHRVLNANQDEEEANIVSQAGKTSSITVVTNMAGRGTDIKLDPPVLENGGLHVIITERHEARRIDRQLAGRCARQGEEGSVEVMLSLDDPLFFPKKSYLLKSLVAYFLTKNNALGTWFGVKLVRGGQRKLEGLHFQARKDLLEYDRHLDKQLSFSGTSE